MTWWSPSTRWQERSPTVSLEYKDQPDIRSHTYLLDTYYPTLAEVLKEVVTACLASASVRDLCRLGDRRLTEETSKAFKKDKKITKVDNINGIQPS